MKKALVKTLGMSTVAAAASLAALPASAIEILARVISSTPVVQQVAMPRQVCNNQAVITQAPKSGAGALLGALAGGAAGNAIGSGGGRAAATVIGLVGGAMIGDRIEGSDSQVQNVQQCTTQTFYENRASHYNVVYEYSGTQYNVQMVNDPGPYVRLQVTPVGAVLPAPQPYQPAPASQPQTYIQPAPVQQPVYVQPVAYPAYYPQPYYGPSYYAPYYSPIGLSLSFGYSRGYGGSGRGYGGRYRH
ncbi:MAG: glycine zipper 2TM domain-containing protein [Polaromonas sp.]